MDVFVELKAVISDFQAKMAVAREEMDATTKHGGSSFSALSSLGKGAFLGVAAAATAVAAVSVKLGSQLEDAQHRLTQAITDSGQHLSTFAPRIAATDTQMEKFGYTNAQTADALAVMTTGLGSPTKALSLMGTVANLAAFKHISLADAAVAVTKAAEGNQRPLKQLGIDLPIVASSAQKVAVAQATLAKDQLAANAILAQSPHALESSSKAHAAYERALGRVSDAQSKLAALQSAGGSVIDALNKKIGGQAADAAGTFAGKLQVAKARTEDLLAQLGMKLIPVLEKVVAMVLQVVVWFEQHRQAAILLGVAIGSVLVVAMAAYAISAATAAAATIAATWPILAIIAAVAALAVGIYLLATHWSQAWTDIKHWFDDAVKFLRSGFGTLVLLLAGPFAPLLLLALHWQQVWATIKRLASDAWTFLKRIFDDGINFVTSHWKTMVEVLLVVVTGGLAAIPVLIYRYWSQITSFTARMWSDVTGFVARIWHDVVGFFTNLGTDAARIVSQLVGSLRDFFHQMWSDAFGWVNALSVDVVNVFSNLPSAVLNAVGSLLGDMYTFGAQLIQKIIDGVGTMTGGVGAAIGNAIKTGIKSIPGVGPIASLIPGFAEGGLVTRRTLAWIGESGPELVVPLSKLTGSSTTAGASTASLSAGLPQAPAGDLVLQVSGAELARVAGRDLLTWLLQQQRNGPLGFRAS